MIGMMINKVGTTGLRQSKDREKQTPLHAAAEVRIRHQLMGIKPSASSNGHQTV